MIHNRKVTNYYSKTQKEVIKILIRFALMHCYANAFLNAKNHWEEMSQFSKSASIFTLMSNYIDENVHDKIVHW